MVKVFGIEICIPMLHPIYQVEVIFCAALGL